MVIDAAISRMIGVLTKPMPIIHATMTAAICPPMANQRNSTSVRMRIGSAFGVSIGRDMAWCRSGSAMSSGAVDVDIVDPCCDIARS